MRVGRVGRVGRGVRTSGRVCALAFVLLPTAAIVAACVDGVTPDCSDPKVQCGPDLDGAADRAEASETGSADTSAPDVADSQPNPDAGDEI